MNNNLYQKSLNAIFLILIVMIFFALQIEHRLAQRNAPPVPEKAVANLETQTPPPIAQIRLTPRLPRITMPLEGFVNLSEEANYFNTQPYSQTATSLPELLDAIGQ